MSLLIVSFASAVNETRDLLLYFNGAQLEAKDCDYSITPNALSLSDNFLSSSFVIKNNEDFAFTPLFVVVGNGTLDGVVSFSDGVVNPDGSASFTYSYYDGLFSQGANFTGFVVVSSLDCYDEFVPITVVVSDSHKGFARFVDWAGRPVLGVFGLSFIFLFWVLFFTIVFYFSLKNRALDNKPFGFVGAMFLVLLSALLFSLFTFLLCGGFV